MKWPMRWCFWQEMVRGLLRARCWTSTGGVFCVECGLGGVANLGSGDNNVFWILVERMGEMRLEHGPKLVAQAGGVADRQQEVLGALGQDVIEVSGPIAEGTRQRVAVVEELAGVVETAGVAVDLHA